jgi:hypothetical protein
MVVFPKELVATRYPGYFWNIVEKRLYSIKVSGELHPLKFHRGGVYYGKRVEPGYRISVRGVRKLLPMAYLGNLGPDPVQQEIQYEYQ